MTEPTLEEFVTGALEGTDAVAYTHEELTLAVTKLAQWGEGVGMPLETAVLLAPSNLDWFISDGVFDLAVSSRGNLRSQLRRIAEVHGLILRSQQPLWASDATAPYTPAEVTDLRSWAKRETTERRRADAATLLALGLGAGLSAKEIALTRARHILPDEHGAVVDVHGERVRQVRVLDEWAEILTTRKGELGDEDMMFRKNHEGAPANLISNFVARSSLLGVKPQTQRLRATWIVGHLNRGTPVTVLMDAAGVQSLESFSRYTPFIDAVPGPDARDWLRGTKAATVPVTASSRRGRYSKRPAASEAS